ncbi:hypothetical protein EV659_10570 [Rhodothalassium salexigens DSM 2132]|uniref:Uncharacterized protein n=1 Tax=Rhodothalassium salexigens DSM 2132 TaxID=1188247 RepID=A0A4R2PID3_RHOSA|nr:hypothetical protein [Rhodothalassium salexigens]MBB4211624.1 hypothetical protein [Rhodothalassium salexigens DSM 2132]MBK1639088.1 hypothetical protein [Rhodothalassium salexigens DSM 2132]TCP34444.1 hypothetical protein EV659_10570 [Rhodothalassium salexigens DSM 2132]
MARFDQDDRDDAPEPADPEPADDDRPAAFGHPPLHDPHLKARRAHLTTGASPLGGHACSVALTLSLPLGALTAPAEADLVYVPARLVLDPASLDAYGVALCAEATTGAVDLHRLAATIAADLADAVLPRYLHVRLAAETGPGVRAEVRVEDRQPGWHGTVPGPAPGAAAALEG